MGSILARMVSYLDKCMHDLNQSDGSNVFKGNYVQTSPVQIGISTYVVLLFPNNGVQLYFNNLSSPQNGNTYRCLILCPYPKLAFIIIQKGNKLNY